MITQEYLEKNFNRPIRFRVWNNKTQKWVHGYKDEVNLFGEAILLGGFMYRVGIQELNDCFALQYIGLNDKNGKEIYEGDIVKQERFDDLNDGKTGVIMCTGLGFHIIPFGSDVPDLVEFRRPLEVIGNICDNPELL